MDNLVVTVNLFEALGVGAGLLLLVPLWFLIKYMFTPEQLPELSDLGNDILDVLDNDKLTWEIREDWKSISCTEFFRKDKASTISVYHVDELERLEVFVDSEKLELNKTDKLEISALAEDIFNEVSDLKKETKDKLIVDTLGNFKNRE